LRCPVRGFDHVVPIAVVDAVVGEVRSAAGGRPSRTRGWWCVPIRAGTGARRSAPRGCRGLPRRGGRHHLRAPVRAGRGRRREGSWAPFSLARVVRASSSRMPSTEPSSRISNCLGRSRDRSSCALIWRLHRVTARVCWDGADAPGLGLQEGQLGQALVGAGLPTSHPAVFSVGARPCPLAPPPRPPSGRTDPAPDPETCFPGGGGPGPGGGLPGPSGTHQDV
jgi:hypothetical protein